MAAYDPYQLAGLGVAVPALGSLVLGLALAAGELDANEAFGLGALEELFQAEQWGEDLEAATRRQNVAADIALAARSCGWRGGVGASSSQARSDRSVPVMATLDGIGANLTLKAGRPLPLCHGRAWPGYPRLSQLYRRKTWVTPGTSPGAPGAVMTQWRKIRPFSP